MHSHSSCSVPLKELHHCLMMSWSAALQCLLGFSSTCVVCHIISFLKFEVWTLHRLSVSCKEPDHSSVYFSLHTPWSQWGRDFDIWKMTIIPCFMLRCRWSDIKRPRLCINPDPGACSNLVLLTFMLKVSGLSWLDLLLFLSWEAWLVCSLRGLVSTVLLYCTTQGPLIFVFYLIIKTFLSDRELKQSHCLSWYAQALYPL